MNHRSDRYLEIRHTRYINIAFQMTVAQINDTSDKSNRHSHNTEKDETNKYYK